MTNLVFDAGTRQARPMNAMMGGRIKSVKNPVKASGTHHQNDLIAREIGDKPKHRNASVLIRRPATVNAVSAGRREILLRSTIMIVIAALSASAPAFAQGKVDARYTVTLSGLPIGKGAWVIDIGDEQFTAAASGATTGLLRVFSKGQGTGATRGFVVNGVPIGATFAASLQADKKTEEIRLSIVGSTVKDATVMPPPDFNPERVPVTDAHRRNVMDPMTATLFRVPGTGSVFGPDACPSQVSAFDGRLRYDLRTAFKRLERVKAERGYEGLAVVCAVYFVPIAGHVPSRYAIRYLAEQRDAEAWLVPIAGTRVMAPFRVSIPTPLGEGVMQATQFLTVAQPPKLPRTQ